MKNKIITTLILTMLLSAGCASMQNGAKCVGRFATSEAFPRFFNATEGTATVYGILCDNKVESVAAFKDNEYDDENIALVALKVVALKLVVDRIIVWINSYKKEAPKTVKGLNCFMGIIYAGVTGWNLHVIF